MTDSTPYQQELLRALTRVGIRGARRERIITEFGDHLDCNPHAELGDPDVLADQFADELGTSFARTAARWAFVALALAGILVGIRVTAFLPSKAIDFSTYDTLGLVVSALAGQVALSAGGLGLLRLVSLREKVTIPRQEAVVLARRAGIGMAAGAITILAFPITQTYGTQAGALGVGNHPTTWWWPAFSAVGLVALVAAAPAVVRAVRLRPQAEGPAGDLLSDLGPLRSTAARVCGGSVSRLSLMIAAGLAVVIALAGVAAGDPYDGILRGLLESGAFLGGYATLGRYLAIKPSTRAEPGGAAAGPR